MTIFRERIAALALPYRSVKGSLRVPAIQVWDRWNALDAYMEGRRDCRSEPWCEMIEWFAREWPDGLEWPAGVPRPPATRAVWRPREMLRIVVPAYCAAQGQAVATVSGIILSEGPRLTRYLDGVQDMQTQSVWRVLAFCAMHWPDQASERWPVRVYRPTTFEGVPPNARRPRPRPDARLEDDQRARRDADDARPAARAAGDR